MRYPLCWGQQWSWTEQQRPAQRRSPVLVLSHVMAVPETVDVDAVRRAVRLVVTRHAALRSTFDVDGAGQPQQVAWPPEAGLYELRRFDHDDCLGWLRREFDIRTGWPLRI